MKSRSSADHNATTQLSLYQIAVLTIEGIMRKDRGEVFASTQVSVGSGTTSVTKNSDLSEAVRAKVGGADVEQVPLKLVVTQLGRKPLHPEVIARVRAAHALGVRVLKNVPRIGAYTINDPEREFYLPNGQDDELRAWIEKTYEVARAIEGRGVGLAQLKALGLAKAIGDRRQFGSKRWTTRRIFTRSAPSNGRSANGLMETP